MLIYALAVLSLTKERHLTNFTRPPHSVKNLEKAATYLSVMSTSYDNHFNYALSSKENQSVLMMRKCIESTKEAIDRHFVKG